MKTEPSVRGGFFCRILMGCLIPALVLTTLEMTMPLSAQAGSRLASCPHSPNCVSSLAPDGARAIAPIPLKESSPDQSFACLKRIVSGMKRTRIATEERGYLHVEFRTLLGFVDDVEFEIDVPGRVIHMRSASRLGYWDLGLNRKRLEAIRAAFEEACR